MFLNVFKADRHPRNDHFVEDVRVRTKRHPVDWLIIGGWSLILIKCILASIAIRHWNIPIADFYVWGPSFIFGGICTTLYLTRDGD